MSSELYRELFRNVENVIRERFNFIEEVIRATKQTATEAVPGSDAVLVQRIEDLEGHFKSLDEYTMGQIRTLAYNHDMLEKRVENMESAMKSAIESFQTINETIGSLQKRVDEKPVEAAEVEAEIEETQEAALNVEEEEVEAEAAEEEEAEEEAEDEEEESPYNAIFTYKDRTYVAHNETNQVYILDEEGTLDPDAVVGTWSAKTEKLWMPEKGKWWDYKTNKYTDPKTKK